MTTISNIDLHCHTTASDGSLSPSQLVARAYQRGLNFLAITDHDLVAGVAEAQAAAVAGNALLLSNAPGLPVETFIKPNAEVTKVTPDGLSLERSPAERLLSIIPGVEFSVTWREEQIHIVGLFVDIHNDRLKELVAKRKISRTERALEIAHKLETLGIEKPYERCCAKAKEGASITRGNYARLIFEDGLAKTIDEAFNRYLRRGEKAYVRTIWGPLDECVDVIKAAGGVAVIAHPRRYNFNNLRLRRLVEEFKAVGGEALEVSSSQQKPNDREYLGELCQRYDLLASLGSDFHNEGIYRDLGQNLDLDERLRPIWQVDQAKNFGLTPTSKQRLVHITYKKDVPAE